MPKINGIVITLNILITAVKDIDKALFENTKTGFIGPIKTELGFHLFDVIKRYKKGSELGLESSYDEIYQRLLKRKKSNKKKRCVVVAYNQSDIFNFIKPTSRFLIQI